MHDIDFTKEYFVKLLESENQKILTIQNGIIDVASKFGIAVTMNNRNGHCLNMSVVGGGINKVHINENGLELENLGRNQIPSPRSSTAVSEFSNVKNSVVIPAKAGIHL